MFKVILCFVLGLIGFALGYLGYIRGYNEGSRKTSEQAVKAIHEVSADCDDKLQKLADACKTNMQNIAVKCKEEKWDLQ
jgi:hypothetical protein